jgi:4-alpha-glucanotransferase
MRKNGYKWWIERINNAQKIFDVVRVDHFRGLDRFWSIPVSEQTAINGTWEKADGAEIFKKITNRKIIAEDLGTLDDGVYKLINDTGFASMKVVLFAFGDNNKNPYLPWNINENAVCYTGTHDNETIMGYLKGLSKKDGGQVR